MLRTLGGDDKLDVCVRSRVTGSNKPQKRLRAVSDELTVEIAEVMSLPPDAPNWAVRITGQGPYYDSGWHVDRSFEVELSPRDLQQLFGHLCQHGLLRIPERLAKRRSRRKSAIPTNV